MSRWARTARGEADCVALGSHCASRARPAQVRSASAPVALELGAHRPGPGPRLPGPRRCGVGRTDPGAVVDPVPAPFHPAPAGSARSSLNPRARLLEVRARGLPGDLASQVTISRPRPGRVRPGREPGPGPRRRTRRPGRLPGWRRPGTGVRNSRSAQRNPGADPSPACVMRAQRDTVRPTSRRASPARRNPPQPDPYEPTWRNASPGDITESTPQGPGPPWRRGRAGPGRRSPPGRAIPRGTGVRTRPGLGGGRAGTREHREERGPVLHVPGEGPPGGGRRSQSTAVARTRTRWSGWSTGRARPVALR